MIEELRAQMRGLSKQDNFAKYSRLQRKVKKLERQQQKLSRIDSILDLGLPANKYSLIKRGLQVVMQNQLFVSLVASFLIRKYEILLRWEEGTFYPVAGLLGLSQLNG